MSTQRYISTSFWDDGWIQELLPASKLLYMYLLTNPLTNIAGVYKITVRRIAFDTGLTPSEITEILKDFESRGKAAFVSEYIILPNWPKYQKTTSKDTKAGIDRVLADLPRDVFLSLERLNYKYPIGPHKGDSTPPIGPHKAPHRPPIGHHKGDLPTLNSSPTPILTPSGMQAESTQKDDHSPDSAMPAACPLISPEEVKSACLKAPFQMRLSARDLEDIATRLSTESLDARFVEYVIARAQDDGIKNHGAFARSALLGSGAFSEMPDEYRESLKAQPPEPAKRRPSPPERCTCGTRLARAGDLVVCKACGAIWEYDEDFETWGPSGEKWRVEELEKTG